MTGLESILTAQGDAFLGPKPTRYPEERLKGLPPEERLKGLPPKERLKGLPPEERLKGLSPEMIEAYLLKLNKKD